MELGQAETLVEKAALKIINDVQVLFKQKNITLDWKKENTINKDVEIIRYKVFSTKLLGLYKDVHLMLQFSIYEKKGDWDLRPKTPVVAFIKHEFYDEIDVIIRSKNSAIIKMLGPVDIEKEFL